MPPTKNPRLGKAIRQARQEKGLSLRQLSEASGVDYSTIYRFEQGEFASPDPIKLQKLARALEIEMEDFYALAGYTPAEGLPGLAPYLRAKYDLPEEATADVERYVERLKRRYGPKPAKSTKQPRRPR